MFLVFSSQEKECVRILLYVLFHKLKEAAISVLPVAAIVVLLDLTSLIDLTSTELIVFLIAAVCLIIGIGLFSLGADLAMTPMGEHIGAGLTKSRSIKLLLSVCFLMGLLITVAEPDLSVLASQVDKLINGTVLIVTVGIGVGIFLLLSVMKIIFKKPLSSMLIFFYMLLFALSALILLRGNEGFLALGFDSGGVTTGPITVPFIMALGVGIAGTLGGKNSGENSFGLIAMCSIGPILAVMVLGVGASGTIDYPLNPSEYNVTTYLGMPILIKLWHTMQEVALALGLIIAFFVVLQLFVLKLPNKTLIRMAVGIAYTFGGLVLFLTAVSIGFFPIGYRIGSILANKHPALLVGFGFILGMVVVLAEPAVQVLNKQVEGITDGTVSRKSMMIALSIGVGISIGLSMLRIVLGFNILYYVIPGYFISLGLSFFVPGLYTAIAFDSGGVASGPLTSGFILPLSIGACVALQGSEGVMSYAFGVVAMVAMTPLITIQILGFRAILANNMRKRIAMKRILSADDEQIINFM